MKPDTRCLGLFMDKLNGERLSWLTEIFFDDLTPRAFFYLTGQALYSSSNFSKNASVILDHYERNLMGLVRSADPVGTDKLEFFNDLLRKAKDYGEEQKFGFLQLRSAYMSRTSVYTTRILSSAFNNDFIPELYLYLDGLHMMHQNQKPSEFENILQSIENIAADIDGKFGEHNFMACSRCATARGYVDSVDSTGKFISTTASDAVKIVNLKKIVEAFTSTQPIFSPNSINIFNASPNQGMDRTIQLTVFITHDPYSTEYPFGGLSFAVACANQGIKTNVVLIEDGVFCAIDGQDVNPDDKVFSMADIITSTQDDANIEYSVYQPSAFKRNLHEGPKTLDLIQIGVEDLRKKIKTMQDTPIHRILLF